MAYEYNTCVQEEKRMYYDEDSDEEIKCGYCGKTEECEHLFAIIDRSYSTCNAGYAEAKFHKLEGIFERAFLKALRSGADSKYVWEFPNDELDVLLELSELMNEEWDEAIKLYSQDQEAVYVNVFALVEEFLSINIDMYFNAIQDFGLPGQSSALRIFYSSNPMKEFDDLVGYLEEILEVGPVETGA